MNDNDADENRRIKYREPMAVRELAGLLRGENPAEVDSWVAENIVDLNDARLLFGALLKYLVARGL